MSTKQKKSAVKAAPKPKKAPDVSPDSDVEIELVDEEPNEEPDEENQEPEEIKKPKKTKKLPVKKTKRTKTAEDDLDAECLAKHIANNTDANSLSNESDNDSDAGIDTSKIIGNKAKLLAIGNIDDDTDEVEPDEEVKRKPRAKKTIVKGTKKGPGRPRKTPKKEPIPRKGIAKTPQSAESHVEVLYTHPLLLKKIFLFFDAIKANDIQIIFRPKEIIFYTVDHHDVTRIRVKVDATKLHSYYCRSALDICINSDDISLILNKVDKDYSSIVIISDTISNKSEINIVLENDMQVDETHRLKTITPRKRMEDEDSFIDEDYMIRFKLPSKFFKKTISDIKTMSSNLGITQDDNKSPIVFEYVTHNKKTHSKHTLKDSNKIELQTNLSDDESFRIDVQVDHLKPIASAQLAPEINILVDENKNFMTIAYIDDGTIEVKTLTNIVDLRTKDVDDD